MLAGLSFDSEDFLVAASSASFLRLSLFMSLMTTKIAKATMRKLTTFWMKLP